MFPLSIFDVWIDCTRSRPEARDRIVGAYAPAANTQLIHRVLGRSMPGQ
jgi:hypothetical protein